MRHAKSDFLHEKKGPTPAERDRAVSFEAGLYATLTADPALGRRGKRILEILDARPSKLRTRRLDRMERHARASLGRDAIDWSTVDWAKVIETIMKVLMALLKFI